VIRDARMQKVIEARAHTIITTYPGWLLQMGLVIKRHGLESRIRVVHLVELPSEQGLCLE
jgi:glycolate oxidase iron-sulfur subunit